MTDLGKKFNKTIVFERNAYLDYLVGIYYRESTIYNGAFRRFFMFFLQK